MSEILTLLVIVESQMPSLVALGALIGLQVDCWSHSLPLTTVGSQQKPSVLLIGLSYERCSGIGMYTVPASLFIYNSSDIQTRTPQPKFKTNLKPKTKTKI